MDGLECSEISLSEIDRKLFRIEAEYFQKKYREADELLEKYDSIQKYKKKIECGPFGSNLLDSEYKRNGVLVVRPFNIVNCTIENERLVYISKETVQKNNLKEYSRGSLLFSRVGDIKVGFANKDHYTISPNIIIADFQDERLAKYAAVFFNTHYGFIQIKRQLKVAAQPTISTEIISRLKLPIFSKIYNAVVRSVDLAEEQLEKSLMLYSQSKEILLSALKIDNAISSKNTIAIKPFSESLYLNGRLDAEYYQPKYDNFLSALKQFDTTSIPDEFYVYKNSGTDYADEISDVGVIKTKQLTNTGINYDGVESFFDNKTCVKNKSTCLVNDDVVFASMGVGSLGKVSLFAYSGNKRFVTDSTLRIYRKKPTSRVKPEVLCIFLQSKIGQELIYRYVVGSTGIINIYDTDIAKIPIPILDESVQKQIVAKVQESFALRHKSEQLLENAKRAVEIAIEQGEDQAMKWLKEKGVGC